MKNGIGVTLLNQGASLYFDFLRVLLSQLVLIGHAASFYSVLDGISPPKFPWIQSIAVVGFFWLSGFLIFYSVQVKNAFNGGYRFRSFFIDRFSRIYSAYIPAIFFVFFIDGVFILLMPEQYQFYYSFNVDSAIKNLLMLQKHPLPFISSPMFGSASAWWSLSIEWWLYMFFGAIIFIKYSQAKAVLCLVLLISFVIPLKYTVLGNGYVGVGLSLSWFLACYMALCKERIINYFSPNCILLFSFTLMGLAVIRYKISMDSYDAIASVYFGSSLVMFSYYFQSVDFNVNFYVKLVVGFMSKYSFTLFLTHYSVLYFMVRLDVLDGWSGFVMSVILSNFIAIFLAYFTEFKHKRVSLYLKKLFKVS